MFRMVTPRFCDHIRSFCVSAVSSSHGISFSDLRTPKVDKSRLGVKYARASPRVSVPLSERVKERAGGALSLAPSCLRVVGKRRGNGLSRRQSAMVRLILSVSGSLLLVLTSVPPVFAWGGSHSYRSGSFGSPSYGSPRSRSFHYRSPSSGGSVHVRGPLRGKGISGAPRSRLAPAGRFSNHRWAKRHFTPHSLVAPPSSVLCV
jgi:hypothetical protein